MERTLRNQMKRNIDVCRDCIKFLETTKTRQRHSTRRMGCGFETYLNGRVLDEEDGFSDVKAEQYIELDTLPDKCPMKLEHLVIK